MLRTAPHLLVFCSVLLAAVSSADAAVGRKDGRCIAALNQAGARAALASAQAFTGCLRAAGKGKVSADACAAVDSTPAVVRADARTRRLAGRLCATPPPFGPTSVDGVNAAFSRLLHPRALFGPDLPAAIIPAGGDRAGAACQAAVAGALVQVTRAKLNEFNACLASGLKHGTIAAGADLAACDGPDPHGRVARAVAKAQRLASRKCAATPVAKAFPGDCARAPLGGLLGCVERCAACDVCLALDAANGIERVCPHQFVDGVAAPYCGERPAETRTIARIWDEEMLDAIRQDTPRPTVHARNLFHVSAAMYDAWVAYSTGPEVPWLTSGKPVPAAVAVDRDAAISFAAYRILSQRYSVSPNAATTQAALDARMLALGYDKSFTSTAGDAGTAVGNRIAAAMLAYGLADGANEAANYADPTYAALNPPLIVKNPGDEMADPNHWQPLALDFIIAQNGIPLPDKVQSYVGPQWNAVKPFAMMRGNPDDVYIDFGGPPLLFGAGDADFRALHVQLIEFSSELDTSDGVTLDISPGARGNNPLGTNDGTGYATNPVTGQPYTPHVVKRGDWARVLAEFWADGPKSETPPGHWNVIANYVTDNSPASAKRIGGSGPVLDPLEWDVKLYFALNGSVHDAAISAWGLKRKYDSVRPISGIRYLAGHHESDDPGLPWLLPLVPGLVEVITPETTTPGARHAHLATCTLGDGSDTNRACVQPDDCSSGVCNPHLGEIAVRSWPGEPADPKTQVSGAQWILGIAWVPYQKKTFVTPAFPGYASGHSTFSRSAAEVMARFTGSPFFPGGLAEFRAPKDAYLTFERGPTDDVVMQWATYYDAADEAGLSRRYGGIHIAADDLDGRRAGAQIGVTAFELAQRYFDGSVTH